MKRSIILIATVSAVLLAVSMVCSCKSGVATDDAPKITADDVIRLDGTFDEIFMESWEYIMLDDSNPDAIMANVEGILFDDDMFFIMSGRYGNNNSQIKVFDRNGKYLHDIGHMGRARNEYIRICDWAIDIHSKEIIVFDNFARALKRYNYDGEYLGESPMPATEPAGGFIGEKFVKCQSDGSLMYQGGGICIIPSYDFFFINSDGTFRSPLAMTEYKAYCEMDPYEFIKIAGDIGGITMTMCHSNILSDTTYLLRYLDNHIYKVTSDTAQCLANMAFIPEIPKKVKYNFDNDDYDEYNGRSIPNHIVDMQKYLYMWYYYDNAYLYEKSTSKMYSMSHDSLHISLPDLGALTVCDNTIIGCADDYSITHALRRMDSPSYDHRYTPELEAFYRKAKNYGNTIIVMAHYK